MHHRASGTVISVAVTARLYLFCVVSMYIRKVRCSYIVSTRGHEITWSNDIHYLGVQGGPKSGHPRNSQGVCFFGPPCIFNSK